MTTEKPRKDWMCGARNRDGSLCRQSKMRSTQRCYRHGGKAPQVQKAARRRERLAKVTQAVNTYGLPLDIDPERALLQEVQRTAGHVAWLAEKVQSLDEDALIWGRTAVTTEVEAGPEGRRVSRTEREEAQANIWVDLYMRERKHLADVTRIAIGSGIEQRKIEIAQQHIDLFTLVIGQTLASLGHDPSDPRIRALIFETIRSAAGSSEQPLALPAVDA